MTVKLVPKQTQGDEAIFAHATTAGCKPIWADGLLGWAWHCGCEGNQHGVDQQCSVLPPMLIQYEKWITAYVAKCNNYLRGRCTAATKEMCEAFPELRRQSGFANGTEHFWCVAPDGSVVDPTAAQFRSQDPSSAMFDIEIEYEPLKVGDEIRVGKCMNCGSPIFATIKQLEDIDNPKLHRTFCDEDCEKETRAYLGW